MFDSFERVVNRQIMDSMVSDGLITDQDAVTHYTLLFFIDGTEQ